MKRGWVIFLSKMDPEKVDELEKIIILLTYEQFLFLLSYGGSHSGGRWGIAEAHRIVKKDI